MCGYFCRLFLLMILAIALSRGGALAVDCTFFDESLVIASDAVAVARSAEVAAVAKRPTMTAAFADLEAMTHVFQDVASADPQRVARLDVAGFTEALDRKLDKSVSGYTLLLRQNGSTIHTSSGGWARRPGETVEGDLKWNADRRMHVASISKLITAIGMVRLLNDKGISVDAKIIDYLPAHWQKGPNIDQITFRQLLRHESGFDTRKDYSDYRFMRAMVAKGVAFPPVLDPRGPPQNNPSKTRTGVGIHAYQNMNFGLVRILIPIINGNIARDSAVSDEDWDNQTVKYYELYVRSVVFAPAGVTGAKLARSDDTALAYDFPPTLKGWDTGKLTCMAGGAGWYMSLNEVINVMGAFRRGGQIMSPTAAQNLLDDMFGIDQAYSAGTGKLYSKTGFWWHTPTFDEDFELEMEQGIAYFLPENMELVVLANSRVALPDRYLVHLVTPTYLAHMKAR